MSLSIVVVVIYSVLLVSNIVVSITILKAVKRIKMTNPGEIKIAPLKNKRSVLITDTGIKTVCQDDDYFITRDIEDGNRFKQSVAEGG